MRDRAPTFGIVLVRQAESPRGGVFRIERWCRREGDLLVVHMAMREGSFWVDVIRAWDSASAIRIRAAARV
jgi:hypothetical protein